MPYHAISCHIMPHHATSQLPAWTMNIFPECLKLEIPGNLVRCLRRGVCVSFCRQCLATAKSISNTQTKSSHSASLKFSVLKPVFLNYVNISPNDVALCWIQNIWRVISKLFSLWIFTNPQIIRKENFHICFYVAVVNTDMSAVQIKDVSDWNAMFIDMQAVVKRRKYFKCVSKIFFDSADGKT
jgi:hypothetical protein